MLLPEVQTQARALGRSLAQATGERAAYQEQLGTAQKAFALKEEWTGKAAAAQELLNAVSLYYREQVSAGLSSVVERALQVVYGSGYRFEIRFEERRGVFEADCVVADEVVETSPLDGRGGGVADVVSHALRIVVLLLARPAQERFLLLDEAYKHIGASNVGKVWEFLDGVAKEFGLQVLLLTHQAEFEELVGVVYEVERDGSGVSKVRRVAQG